MKKTINGKVYDTSKMTTLASKSHHNSGIYSGSTEIRKTRGGAYCLVESSNGQDLYRSNDIETLDKSEIATAIDGWELASTACRRADDRAAAGRRGRCQAVCAFRRLIPLYISVRRK
jgi:hypothetical protein